MTEGALKEIQAPRAASKDDAVDRAWRLLMERAQEGDRRAYRQLLSELTPFLLRFLRPRLGSAPEAEDVAQECLLSLHLARHTYDPARPFKPWLMAIAHRRLADSFRRRGQQLSREARFDAPDVTFPDLMANSEVEAPLVVRDLRRALEQLPIRQRELLVLVKVRGASLAEAARVVGSSVGNAKVMIHRALTALRRVIDEQDRG